MKRVFLVVLFLMISAGVSSAATVVTNPKFTAWNTDGTPLIGGCLFSYNCGTTTKHATCANATCSSSNTNPIQLDSHGSALVYGDQCYKLALYEAQVDGLCDIQPASAQIWSIDNYYPALLDEDDMVSNSAVSGATQQSIKAYVDAKIIDEDSMASNLATKPPSQQSVVAYSEQHGVRASRFGVTMNGTTDDLAALNLAIDYCKANGFRELILGTGTMKLSNPPHDFATAGSYNGIAVTGSGMQDTIIDITAFDATEAAFTFTGGSGSVVGKELSNLTILGNGIQIGVKMNCLDGYGFDHVQFKNLGTGILWTNAAGGFTEYSVAKFCLFLDCDIACKYSQDGGASSFHGTGLWRCMISGYNTDNPIQIGAGCMPYNAPMDFQIWTTSTANRSIIQNNSSLLVSTHGTITVEAPDGIKVYLVNPANYPTFHAGNIVGTGIVKTGRLVQAKKIIFGGPADGNLARVELETQFYTDTLSAGANTLGVGISERLISSLGCVAYIQVSGTNYEDHVMLYLEGSNYGSAGTASIIKQGFATNVAALTAYPAYSVDSSRRLVVTLPADITAAGTITMTMRVEGNSSTWVLQN
jgi:hypothetical protein